MRLISCYIANFGLHHDLKIDFAPGMNSFAWDNGAGKTTLSVFIKAMLYGLGDNRTKKDENDRKKCAPWQGGTYGGSITFEAGGRSFIARRSFGKTVSDDTFELFDEKTGGVSNFYTENLGKELFGIDCDGFMRTVFWSEKSIAKDDRVSPSVASRLSDIMGADGDVGSYDAALKKLDERRKIYQKRGGGEIGELQGKISALRAELDELELLARQRESVRSDLSEIRGKIKALSDERERLNDRLVELAKISARRKYRTTYQAFLDEIRKEEEEIAKLDKFFSYGIPSDEEIRQIRSAEAEANSISAELSVGAEANAELDALTKAFATVGQVDIENAEAAIREVACLNDQLQLFRCGTDEYSVEMRKLFPAKVPTAEQIEENIRLVSEGKAKGRSPITIIGALILLAGVGLGFIHPALFGICALGAILLAFGIMRGGKESAGTAEARKFLCEIEPGFEGDVLMGLYEKKNARVRYESLYAMREQRLCELTERIDSGRRFIDNFFTRVGTDGSFPEFAIKEIKEKHFRYSTLLASEEMGASDRFKRRKREGELRVKVAEFCGRYPTSSSDPLSEIEEKARQRATRIWRLNEKKAECEKFKLDYGISDNEEPFDEAEEFNIRERIREIDAELSELKKDEASVASRDSAIVARLDTEEDIRTELMAKEERLATCKRNLFVIEKTKELLEIAHENMTLRYTGATQKRFTHYMSIIDGEVGEYRLDTDFGITKTDGGMPRGEEQYSRGTKELYSLAMRLALTDSLYEGELPFLVLDDPFIAYDDARGERARKLLSAIAKERQVLYFTCSQARGI